MHRSIAGILSVVALGSLSIVSAISAEKEDPAKFKYRNLPVEASCLDGYHPTIDAEGNKVFPCIANAEIVVSTDGTIKGKAGATK